MNARITATLPLVCFSLALAACGGAGEGDSADAGFGDDDFGETGNADAGNDDGDAGLDAGLDGGNDDNGGNEGGEGGADGNEAPEPEPCDAYEFSLDTLTPNVMLVLDKSGSMNQFTWDDDGDSLTPEVTRWHSLHGVVAQLASDHEDAMNLGVTLFPSAAAEVQSGTFEGACVVSDTPEVPVGPGNAAAVIAAIPSADDMEFAGATPATAGFLTAAAHLEQLGDDLPRAIIFVTDGAANCVSPDNFVTEYDADLPLAVADAWKGAGIPTYVVGIDIGTDGGSVEINPRKALDELALAGGVSNEGEVGFYDATTPDALSKALTDITTRVGCQLELELVPEQLADMTIVADGQEFGQVNSCEAGDGWVQVDPINEPTLIELCNAACESVAEAGSAEAQPVCG